MGSILAKKGQTLDMPVLKRLVHFFNVVLWFVFYISQFVKRASTVGN